MADVKISQLPVATTPLDGTEVLPIVQSATTKQVSIANVTAGRAVSALSLSLTNALPVTSGGTGISTTAAGTLLSSTALNTISATATPTLGVAGTTAGTLGLSGVTSGVVTLATADAAGTWTMKLPTSGGTNGYILTTNGSGVTSWTNPTALGIDLDVGSTAITGATDKYVLYNNNGTLGNYAVTGTGTTVVLSTSPTFTTGLTTPLAIGGTTASSSLTLQSTSGVGTTDSILFKVGNNGATTAATIDTSGNFGIGATQPSLYGKLAVLNTSAGNVTAGAVLINNSANSVNSGVGLYFDPNGAQLARAASIQSVQTTSGNYANLQFFVAGGGTPVQALTINTSGNLGIGSESTTVPTNFRLKTTGTAGSNTLAASSGTTQSASAVMRLQAGGGFTGTLDIGQGGGTGSWLQSCDTSNLATNYPLWLNPNGGNVYVGPSTGTSYQLNVGGQGIFQTSAQDQLIVYSNSASNGASIRLASGNGTTSPSYSYIDFVNYASSQYAWAVGTFGNNSFTFYDRNASSSRASIATTGDFLVGTTSDQARLTVVQGTASSTLAQFTGTSGAALTLDYQANGNHYYSADQHIFRAKNGTTVWGVFASALTGSGNRAVYSDPNGTLTNSSSDLTLKTNINPVSYGLEAVMQFLPIIFNWKDTARFGEQAEIGFGAQDMQKVVPEVIGVNGDGTLSLDYPKLTAVLAKAIQELAAKIAALEAKQ